MGRDVTIALFIALGIAVLLIVILTYLFMQRTGMEAIRESINKGIASYQQTKTIDELLERKSFWDRKMDELDAHLYQAGIKGVFTTLSPERFLICMILIAIAILVWVLAFTGKMLIAVCCSVTFTVAVVMAISTMRYLNRKRAEASLLETFNLMGQYAVKGEELGIILFKTGASVPAPMGPALQTCYYEILSSGDTKEPLRRLRKKIDLDIFQQIFLMLEICSKYSNNYKRPIDDGKAMVHAYLKTRKEIDMIVKKCITDFFALMLGSLVAIYVIVTGVGERNFSLFWSGTIGKAVIIAYIIAALVFIRKIITFKGK